MTTRPTFSGGCFESTVGKLTDLTDSANPNPAYFSPENPTRNYKKISKRSPTAVEHDTQGQPPKKRQRKSPVQGDTAARNSLARKARGLPEVARANDESVVTVDRPNSKRGRVIGKGKSLKWFDEQDNQWSKPTHQNLTVENTC